MTIAPARTDLEGLLATVAEELGRWQVPGLELALVADGTTAYAGGIGTLGTLVPRPVTARTLFQHGSCGKAYTGLLLVLLAAERLVDLDAPVRRHVPELALPDEVVAARVTTRDLLSHRSGLGRHDLAWIMNPQWTPADVLGRLPYLPLVGDLRAQWSYSNFGYALAGIVAERVTGTTYAEALRARVLEPLGMSRTQASVDVMQAEADSARPHVTSGGAVEETLFRRLAGVAPAGELVSCAADSVRWLRAQLSLDDTLPAAAVRSTHDPSMLLPTGVAPFPELEFTAYGFGWISGRYRGHRLVWHNGGVDGFCTQTLLLPDRRSGAVVSANLHATNLPLAVVLAAADMLIGEAAESSWFDRLRPEEPSPVPPAPRPADVPGPTRALGDLAGTYCHRGYGDLTVTATEAGLSARLGAFPVELSHRLRDTWQLGYPPLEVTGTVTFEAAPDGAVAHALVVFDTDGTNVRMDRVGDDGVAA
ncbi:MAG TPA: serine hydrolase [Mycobacteriales bacterium]|nr:serine hydrolase [Mycobacteriales bacterium]